MVGPGRDGGVVFADASGAPADGICENFPAGPILRKSLNPDVFFAGVQKSKAPAKIREASKSFLQGAEDLKSNSNSPPIRCRELIFFDPDSETDSDAGCGDMVLGVVRGGAEVDEIAAGVLAGGGKSRTAAV